VIELTLGLARRLGDSRRAVSEEGVESISNPPRCTRRTVIGHQVTVLDGLEPDDLS
jgi:hypothetical protein